MFLYIGSKSTCLVCILALLERNKLHLKYESDKINIVACDLMEILQRMYGSLAVLPTAVVSILEP